MIVNSGLNKIADLAMTDISHMAIGTGTTAVAATQTTLATETGRNALAKKSRSGPTIELRALFTNAALPTQMEEMGLFNASSGGTMYNRRLFQYAKVTSRDLLLVQFITFQEG